MTVWPMCTVIRYHNTLLNTEFMIQVPVVKTRLKRGYIWGQISKKSNYKRTLSVTLAPYNQTQ